MLLRDFLYGAMSVEIVCPRKREVVRRLRMLPGATTIRVDALTEAVDVPANTVITFEPWFLDRGNLLFTLPNGATAKLCTEADIVRLPDGTEILVIPTGEN